MQSDELSVISAAAAQNSSGGSAMSKVNPIAVIKGVLILAVIILVAVLLWKFIKGINKVSDKLGEMGPMSEAEKREIVLSPEYQDGLKWLDDRVGIETIVRKGKFKTVSAYLAKKSYGNAMLAKAAEQIYTAIDGGISEDEPAVYTAIASMPTKVMVSLMAGYFNQTYTKYSGGKRLGAYLSAFMDLPELQTVVEIINKKPEL